MTKLQALRIQARGSWSRLLCGVGVGLVGLLLWLALAVARSREAQAVLMGGALVTALFAVALDPSRRAGAEGDRGSWHGAVLEACLDAVVTIDAEGRVRGWNRAAEALFGWSFAEVVGRPLGETIVPPEQGEACRRGVERFVETGAGPILNRYLEVEAVRRDGGRLPVELCVLPVQTKDGWRFTAFVRDIAERQRAIERLQLVVEAAPGGRVMVDREGIIVLVNKALERLFGYRHGELYGRRVDELLPARLRGRLDECMAGFFAEPVAKPMQPGPDLVGLRKDGSELPVEVQLSPLATSEGATLLYASVESLGTEAHETAPLPVLADTLEERVADQAAELEETLKDLGQAKLAARQASESKSLFLANMSHEIRTPLSAVIGMTELVLDTELTDEQRRHLTVVRDAGESLLRLLDDILDLSRIEAGRLSLTYIPFDHDEWLADTLASMRLHAHKKGLELLSRVHPDVPLWLKGDPGRLRQVLVNLIGNAVKFTNRGEVVVDVTPEGALGDVVTLHYSVSDTGIGMDPDVLARVLEPFEQGDPSAARRHGGAGLGLAISRRLVELMGGRLWAESEVGRGSKVHFTIPFAVPVEQPSRPAPDCSVLNGMPALVVDDNESSRRMLRELLLGWGMEAAVAGGGEEALAALGPGAASGSPAPLVLMDLHMPGMDGYELARRMRQEPAIARAAILMLGAGDRPAGRARCHELGVATQLTKPIRRAELLDAILLAVGALPPREPEPAPEPAPVTRALDILLAEDSLVNQQLAVSLLTRLGHRVTVAVDGEQALERWRLGRFDLVLMDVQMPRMDGLEAARAIRAHEREHGRHVPIVAMTAHAMKGDRERCLEAGMDDYVTKPIRRDTLLAAIARLVAGPEPAKIGGP